MTKKFLVVVMTFCLGAVAWAAAENRVDKVGSAFPMWFDKGIYVGPSTSNPTTNTLNKVAALKTCNPTIDIPNAAAATTVTATGTCTGIAVGDVIVGFAPAADDAVFDEGVIFAFAESANTVKLVFHPDATGGDIASMVWYITYIKRQ